MQALLTIKWIIDKSINGTKSSDNVELKLDVYPYPIQNVVLGILKS